MIENTYYNDLRQKPVGQSLGQGKRVEACPKCGKGGYLFKRSTSKHGARKETWHHEIKIELDAGQQPRLKADNVEQCVVNLPAETK